MKKLLFLLATTSAGASLFAQIGQLPIEPQKLNQMAAQMWANPEFQKAFIGSYLPLEELEPEFTNEEKVILREQLLPLITGENPMSALPTLEEIAKKPTSSAGIDFLIGNLYLQNGRTPQAERAYVAATNKFKNYRRAWKNLALIYATTGDFEKALIPLSRAIELGDVNGQNYGLLGVIYMQRGDYLGAESAFRNALMLDPKSKDWKLNLFQSLMFQERYNESNALLRSLISDEPNNAEFWKYQANVYIGLDEPLKAAEVLEIVDRMGATDAQALEMLGTIYFNNQLYDVAYDVYKRALQKSGARFESLFNSANALAAVGNYENAMDLIGQLRSRFASTIEKKERLDLLVLEAACVRAMGESDKAAKILEEIILEDPMNGRALIELGLYFRSLPTPDYLKAIMNFERAANITGFEATAMLEHAKVLVSQRNYREAARLLRRAQDIDYKETVQDFLIRVERAARQF
jgi:tetratricopeptide (TPR) repeat protein